VPAAAALAARSFELDPGEAAEARWRARTALPLRSDPGGSFGALCVRGEPGPLWPNLPSGPYC
jgi:hypothetical protein